MIDIGFVIAISASVIALYGVYQFNQVRDYTKSRSVWFWSNSLFVAYFLGRITGWWDGILGDAAMMGYFALMWISNFQGMKKDV